jgi:pimeloyl-ACP methyl ester carboxylesterase
MSASVELCCHHGSPGSPADFSLLAEIINQKAGGRAVVIAKARAGYPVSALGAGMGAAGVGGPSKRKLLLGYSWGVAECLLEAAIVEDLTGVVLVAPYLFAKPLGATGKMLLKTPGLSELILSLIASKTIEKFLVSSSSPKAVPDAYRTHGATLKNVAALKAAVFEKEGKSEDVHHAIAALARRQTPVLILRGDADQTSDELVHIAPLRSAFKNVKEIVFKGAGHAIPWTHADALAEESLKFVEELMGEGVVR